jgi:uncharacterized repeat protein (TIGR01451 family)
LAETGAVTLDSNAMANPGPPITAAPPPPLAVTCPVGTAQAGVAYNSLLAATGGTPPYTFSITGSPPLGLSLVVATGLLTGTPTAAGSFSFTTNALDSASVNATNNTCSITVAAAAADVSIVKSGPATVATSTNIIYDIAVANAGPSLAAGVTVTDTLPAGTTFVSATPSQGSCTGTSTVSCSLGTVPASGGATVQLVVKSPGTSGTVANTATVAADTPDPNLANNTSTASIKVTAAPSIPTLSTWGVALLALLLLLTGCSRGGARA